MKNILKLLSVTALAIFSSQAFAQVVTGRNGNVSPQKPLLLKYEVVNGDTIYYTELNTVVIYDLRVFNKKADQKRYDNLVRSVKKTLPLANVAKQKLEYYNFMMQGQSSKEQKETLKLMEKQLRAEFTDQLKALNRRDAVVLFKLIDRNTNNTAFALIKDLKGGFNAFFYQLAAKTFKLDLKTDYDPLNNEYDKYIEEIVYMIEAGRI